MKKIVMLIFIFPFILTNCEGQIKTEKPLTVKKDTIKPIEKMKVIKEYDSEGNLISIDSSYYYFYSNIKNDTQLEKEIFNRFKNDFDKQFKSIDSIFKNDFFNKNPFNINDFYTNDFYLNHFNFHNKQIEKIIKDMDSIKNQFYSNQQSRFN